MCPVCLYHIFTRNLINGTKFGKIPPVESEAVPFGWRTDGHDEAFRNFSNATEIKKKNLFCRQSDPFLEVQKFSQTIGGAKIGSYIVGELAGH